MPPEAAPTPTRVTRSSIRHSLTLASVGKALADVMNKSDGKGGGDERAMKRPKEKEASSRRNSAIGMGRGKDAAKPLSVDKASATARNTPSPDAKTITRRTRATAAKTGSSSSEEQSDVKKSSLSPPGIAPVTRASSLRTKRTPASTALPKYKPKAGLETINEPPSPPRKGVRKRSSSTDEDKEDRKPPKSPSLEPPSPLDKAERAISPLPKRAAFHLASAMKVSPRPSTPTKKTTKGAPPSRPTPPVKGSPTRSLRTKAAENAAKQPAARPSSAASSASSLRTRSPTTPPTSLRTAFGLNRTKSTQPASPLSKLVKDTSATSSATNSPKSVGARSTASKSDATRTPTATVNLGDSSTDSMDADDVEFMLSTIVSPTAPTPAMPRFRTQPNARNTHARNTNALPETPSRAGKTVTGRSQTFLTPIPASTDNSPLFPRVSTKNRQSILSWEQLAASSNKSLGEDEIGHLLSDVQAPFNPSAVPSPMASPMHMNLDIPDSPMLSALPSPGGYTSISQVLLPDSTPSPAMHTTQLYEKSSGMMPEMPAVDGAILTLLRLQLASAEQLAQERAARVEELESKLRAAQESRVREEEDLARQINQLEEQLRTSLVARERTNEEKEVYINTLHEQLSQVEAARDQAVQQAVVDTQVNAQAAYGAALSSHKQRWEMSNLATGIMSQWVNVIDVAEGELEFVRSSRETLSTLLAGLAATQKHLRSVNV
ncbi:hypothetical protein NEOLEDRAFT_519910 [Neolentinus lepideus HHB14362 ss-1]|uniref:Uncharacterized protein n=1 Tax=Neolentinus lepideus HHB14362 ss-1 TaxID=1314782 RepID=A0A165RI95_9AGAM|nr:hypothetical protein NEOLEDRAFT_519910 [Neolentinus lepideus HHB14362 ss-1]